MAPDPEAAAEKRPLPEEPGDNAAVRREDRARPGMIDKGNDC